MFEQLGLLGCGLMGGSFALALKQARLVKRVVGYSKSPTTTERARQLGVIDQAAPSALTAVSGCDLVLLAVPVAATEATLKAIQPLITPQMLVMDLGSTKADVVIAARRTLKDQLGSFIPCHPIAGKERAGIEHADADLYRGCQVVLTPIERTLTAQLQRAQALWQTLGCTVRQMSPQAHDAALAAVSHLPHLLAFALLNSIAGQAQGAQHLSLAGPGFRDTTRIAASDPVIWRDILLANRTQVLAQSQALRHSLDALERCLREGDAEGLQQAIQAASERRSRWRMGESNESIETSK